MSRDAHDREDLLRDARALLPRLQMRVELNGCPAEVFVGFREQAVSLYVDQATVFHLTSVGELRRAHVADELIKADRGRLVAMRRERTAASTALVSRELEDVEQQAILDAGEQLLKSLAAAIARGVIQQLEEVPTDGSALRRLRAWLARRSEPIVVAATPHVR